jgi:hypothetical protein
MLGIMPQGLRRRQVSGASSLEGGGGAIVSFSLHGAPPHGRSESSRL